MNRKRRKETSESGELCHIEHQLPLFLLQCCCYERPILTTQIRSSNDPPHSHVTALQALDNWTSFMTICNSPVILWQCFTLLLLNTTICFQFSWKQNHAHNETLVCLMFVVITLRLTLYLMTATKKFVKSGWSLYHHHKLWPLWADSTTVITWAPTVQLETWIVLGCFSTQALVMDVAASGSNN